LALKAAGCTVIRAEKVTGTTTAGREELATLLDFVREGDVLMVTRIDRLARSVADLQDIVRLLRSKGAYLRTEQPIDMGTPAGKAFPDMLSVFAEFETALRRERQMEGISKTKAAGRYSGRKATIDREAVAALKAEGLGVAERDKLLKLLRGRALLFDEPKPSIAPHAHDIVAIEAQPEPGLNLLDRVVDEQQTHTHGLPLEPLVRAIATGETVFSPEPWMAGEVHFHHTAPVLLVIIPQPRCGPSSIGQPFAWRSARAFRSRNFCASRHCGSAEPLRHSHDPEFGPTIHVVALRHRLLFSCSTNTIVYHEYHQKVKACR
jgi:hypothetical protein